MREDFEKIKHAAETWYKTVNKVFCPYLKEYVYFNFHGLQHLKFKIHRRARLEADQFMRFKLLHLAPEIVKMSHTVQGIWDTQHFEPLNKNNRTENVLQNVTYFEFIAVIKNNRIKIILKKVGFGKVFFWSIIPFWKINKSNKVFHEGIPSED